MYKILNIADLKIANSFIETDKIIEFSNDLTKMRAGENDYAHKSNTYLSSAIDIVDSTLNSYNSAISYITSTFITDDISSIYISDGSLITLSLFNQIYNSDAFLTKEGCNKLETECISYINELKNKATSMIIAQLNSSFISQNSVGRIAYGQQSSTSSSNIYYDKDISTNDENENGESGYDFEFGEFSLYNLLFGLTSEKLVIDQTTYDAVDVNGTTPGTSIVPSDLPEDTTTTKDKTYIEDFWEKKYFSPISSFCPNDAITDFDDIVDLIPDNCYLFNSVNTEDSNETPDYKVHVPESSFDYKRNSTIPIAKLIETFLKKQIKKSIKTICDTYLSKMTSIPVMK